jgi:hypothetical protein
MSRTIDILLTLLVIATPLFGLWLSARFPPRRKSPRHPDYSFTETPVERQGRWAREQNASFFWLIFAVLLLLLSR